MNWQIADLAAFRRDAGRVGVLMGGISAEREISLKSGEMIYRALVAANIDAVKIDWQDDLEHALASETFDRIFIALHGRGGEDGQVQGLLGLKNIPYTGSGVLGSSLAMDKIRSKQIWDSCGLPTPSFWSVDSHINFDPQDVQKFPVMVKPAREGSSIGITKVVVAHDLLPAVELAQRYDEQVIIEEFVKGNEYTLSILANQALPIIRLETPHEFYDYEAKYLADSTSYHCPAGLSETLEKECAELGLRAFRALGAHGWGRIDFIIDEDSRPQLIEANTVPGMTDHSLVPMAAAVAGIDFQNLVMNILKSSFGDRR